MCKQIIILVAGCCLALSSPAQTDATRSYRNFPLVVTLQFHSLSMPFRDLKSAFSNVGLGLGTEVSLNGAHNWAQQFNVVWYRNRAAGNGLLFYTQSAWRPTLVSPVFAEVKIGAGYLLSFRPVESYKPVNGGWAPAGHKGKGMFAVPAGVSLGYNTYSDQTYLAPFASYQLLLLTGYSQSVPLVPERLIQVGARVHL